jgi:type VI secretion system FHA domain protein
VQIPTEPARRPVSRTPPPAADPPSRPAPIAPPRPVAGPRAAQTVPPAMPPAAGLDLNSMLRAAGVDPQGVSPEVAATLGQILKLVVQGTIDVLRAREEVKTQFRLAVTRVQASDNNPLTFAVDADDAINSLLNRHNAAFLPPLEAFQRAFDDIRAHQVAMLAGMRAGFENLMARFDPQQLQEQFDKQAKRGGLLGVRGTPKYWEFYADFFAGLRGDREDAFRRLFGEEFSLAYEKQIELLKRSRGSKIR